MSIYLSNPSKNFEISTHRISLFLSGNKKEATHMGLWDRIKDLFRSEKKKEALNDLYTLVSLNQEAYDTSFSHSYSIFQRLKGMALEEQQGIFSVVNDGKNVSFSIDSNIIYEYPCEQLSAEDKIFLDIEATKNLNHSKDIKLEFAHLLKDRCNSNLKEYRTSEEPNQIKQLLKDLPRNLYEFGQYTFPPNSDIDDQIKKESLDNFLKNIPLEQQLTLDVVGTQTAAITSKEAVLRCSKSHAMFGNPDSQYAFYYDNKSHNMIVKVSVESHNTPDRFEVYKKNFGIHEAKYMNLSLQAVFSVAPNGDLECIDLHLANSLKQIGTDLLKTENPSIFNFMHFLEKIGKDIELGWFFKANNSGDAELMFDQLAQRAFMRNVLAQQFETYSKEELGQALDHLEGAFGKRWRGILDFTASQVGQHADNPQLINRCSKYTTILEETINVLRQQLGLNNVLPGPPSFIDNIEQLHPTEIMALSLLDVTPAMLSA